MESLDILILGVEASVAFAGFAGIVATFQFGGAKETRRGDAIGLTMILQFSLLAALACSVAILLYSFDVKETTIWTICSVLAFVMQVWGFRGTLQSMKGVDRTKTFARLTVILQIPTLILMLMHVMNVSDIYFHREAGPVIASVIYGLCIAGFMFSRLLLIPIWRNVRRQEAAKLENAAAVG
jgi:hypothetical protein